MTNPIPGADSERPLPPLPEPWQHFPGAPEGSQKHFAEDQMADYVRADRAAAKVGANVAADPMDTTIEAWAVSNMDRLDLESEVLALRRAIAAGAPAETPKPVCQGMLTECPTCKNDMSKCVDRAAMLANSSSGEAG